MLEINHMSKTLGGRKIIKDISFSVESSMIFGFLGPNGAGKTTTIRLILGLLHPDGGQITFKGQPVDAAARKNIGFVLEEDGLYSNLTLQDNLKFYARLYDISYDAVGDYLNGLLEEFELMDDLNTKVAVFSKGMRRKAAFIRALIHRPQLLLLDEPFDGLDPEMQAVMRHWLQRLSEKEGTAIMMSSHNLYEIERLCRKIAVIRKGQIQLNDYMEHLKAKVAEKAITIEDIYFNHSHGGIE